MNKIGVVAFGITTCVLVPTALRYLQAGPNQVARLVAPDAKSIKIGDATVDVTADRGILDAGGKVHVTVSATSETRAKIQLAVLVFESEGSGGGRVELPPDRIARDEITLDTRDGKASKTLAYTLRGVRGEEMEGRDEFGHYTILVLPPKVADRLERLRRRADRVQNPMDDSTGEFGSFEEAYGSLGGDDDKLGGAGTVARLDVNTRSQDSTVSIIAPDVATAKDDVAVKVRIKNPTKFAIAKVGVELKAKPNELSGTWIGIAEDQVTISDAQEVALAPHETKDVVFHVETTASGTLGLFATARCESDDDCYSSEKNGPHGSEIDDSALDAIDVQPLPDKPDDGTQPVAAAAPAPAAPAAPAPAPTLPPVAKATPPAGTQ